MYTWSPTLCAYWCQVNYAIIFFNLCSSVVLMLMHWYPLMGCSCSRSAACPLTSNGAASFLSFMSCVGFAPRHEAENCLCKSLHEFHFSEKKKKIHFAVFSFPWIISTTHFATDSITEGNDPRSLAILNPELNLNATLQIRQNVKSTFRENLLRLNLPKGSS